jgi:predicted membrane protein
VDGFVSLAKKKRNKVSPFQRIEMFLGLIGLVLPILLFAHQTSVTSGGNSLFWANPSVPLVIRSSTSDMSSSQATAVIMNSMAQWNSSTNNAIQISSSTSAQNEIRFLSHFPYGSGVVGITELSYN